MHDFLIHHAHTAGRICYGLPRQKADQPCKKMDAYATKSCRLETFSLNKTGTDQHIDLLSLHDICHLFQELGIVLPISINLDRIIIAKPVSVQVSCLYGGTNTGIDTESYHIIAQPIA